MKQLTLATAGFERYAKTTRRATFLAEMEQVVPWRRLCRLIEPVYPKAGNGRPPVGLERMPGTAPSRRCGPRSSMPSTPSSGCSASSWFATVGSTRTLIACSSPAPSPTCSWRAAICTGERISPASSAHCVQAPGAGGRGDGPRRKPPSQSDRAAHWPSALQLGYATTSVAAQWRRADPGQRCGTNSVPISIPTTATAVFSVSAMACSWSLASLPA